MSSFYTRTGDDGYTSLLGKERVPKYHDRPEAYGDIDEASAAMGLARSVCNSEITKAILLTVQRDLYGMMAEVASTRENAAKFRVIGPDQVVWLEKKTDEIISEVSVPSEFVVPGDLLPSAALALARTIIRRAERRVVKLYHEDEIENNAIIQYLNRLSSLLFVLELFENHIGGVNDHTFAKESFGK